MNKEKEEMLNYLNEISELAILNLREHDGYESYEVVEVKYCGEIECTNKETGEQVKFPRVDIIAADINNRKETTKLTYVGNEELDEKFLEKYEIEKHIKDKIGKKSEDEEEKSLEELKKGKEKEENSNKEENEQEEDKTDSKEKDEKNEVIKDKKISNLKGEVDLDQQVNGETLRKILDLGEEYDSIAPVRAASIGVPSNSEYVFVAIKNDKTCTVLGEDKILEDRQKGTNPEEKDLMVNEDGEVEKESSLANFRIVNRPNFVMSVRLDEGSSTRETTISDVSGRESRDDDVAEELEKDGDGWIDDDARNSLREENGIGASDDMSKKQQEHEDAGCENKDIENIDDDKNNDTHEHYVVTRDTEVPGKDGMTVEQWAEELGENPDVIVGRLQREADKEDGCTLEDKVKEIESDYEMAGHEHKH